MRICIKLSVLQVALKDIMSQIINWINRICINGRCPQKDLACSEFYVDCNGLFALLGVSAIV